MRPLTARLIVALVVCAALFPALARAINDDVDGSDDCQRLQPPVDFGDAPEGVDAYPGVMGHFPTCLAAGGPGNQTWFPTCPPISSAPGAAAGFVRHEHPTFGRFWLGCPTLGGLPLGIDPEPDGKTNDTGGASSACNNAISVDCVENAFGKSFGQDECYGGDDACLASAPTFHACGPGNVNWTIQAFSCATANVSAYLNILVDWNEDGDWNDNFACPSGCAFEWAVKNYLVTLTPGCNTIFVPTFRVGPNPGRGWMRITLSDGQMPVPDDFPWNGSAGIAGQSLRNGETEDYPVLILPSEIAPCPNYQDWGDAPEKAAAYPGVIGHFPTCSFPGPPGTQEVVCPPISTFFPAAPTGYVRHVSSATQGFGFWLGCFDPFTGTLGVDSEPDGKTNDTGAPLSICGEVPVDCNEFLGLTWGQDECYGDEDAGIDRPNLIFHACQNATVAFKAYDCGNNFQAFLNILVDMNEDGDWNDNFLCGTGTGAQCAYEWAVKNQPILLSPGCNPLTSPPFLVGPNPGKGWLRITLTTDFVPDDFPWNGSVSNGNGFFIGGETEDYPIVIRPDFVGVGDAPRPDELSLAAPAPNPARDEILLRYTLPREAEVSLAVFDLAGRRLAELERGRLPAGEHRVTWNFRDGSGREFAAGYYVIKLRVGDRTLTRSGIRMP